VNGRVISKSIVKVNMLRGCGPDLTFSGYGPVAGSCEHGNEPSGYIERVVPVDVRLSDIGLAFSLFCRILTLDLSLFYDRY
jgi:hypothetical protein